MNLDFGIRMVMCLVVPGPKTTKLLRKRFDILGRLALSAGRLAALGATPDFHHGLLADSLA